MLDLFHQSPLAFFLWIILLGLLAGSFLNVVIARLPLMLSRNWHQMSQDFLTENPEAPKLPKTYNLAVPRSHCPQCNHAISAWENIPLLSYLMLRGRCSECKNKIPVRYPFIELSSALLSLMVAWKFGMSGQTVSALCLVWSLIALTLIDYDHKLLPDNITLPLLWLGLFVNLNHQFVSLSDAVIGAMAGYLVLWSVYWLFKLLRNKEGMGYGDFKLLAALGAWLGWQALPLIILASSLIGAVVGMSIIIGKGRDMNYAIPFGPYLAGAGFIALLWGPEIIKLYLGALS